MMTSIFGKRVASTVSLLACGVCCTVTQSTARAQAVVMVRPQNGELQLDGTIQSIDRAQGRFILLTKHVLAQGTSRILPQPKSKTIVLNSGTTLAVYSPDRKESTLPDGKDDFALLTVGQTVSVIGRNTTTGEVASRLICLLRNNPLPVQDTPPPKPSEPPGKNLLLPTDRVDSWQFTLLDPALGSVTREDGLIKVSVATEARKIGVCSLPKPRRSPKPV